MQRAAQAGLFLESCRTLSRRWRAASRSALYHATQNPRGGDTGPSDVGFIYPAYLRPGNPDIGRVILNGTYIFAGGAVEGGDRGLFDVAPPNATWQSAAYSFDWLPHLIAEGSEQALDLAQSLIAKFSADQLERKPAARLPHIIGRRLMRLNLFYGVCRDRISIVGKSALLTAATRDAHLLAKTVDVAPEGPQQLEAAIGLALTSLWLNDTSLYLPLATNIVIREMKRHILADGGMACRSPEILMNMTADLLALREGLTSRHIDLPAIMETYLPRMQNMLAFMLHSDGSTAKFHGGGPRPARETSPLLPAPVDLRPFNYATKSGFHIMKGDATRLLIDTGTGPRGAAADDAHISPLAFEFSHGGERLIENCGANKTQGAGWHLATRGFPAHSCPTLMRDYPDPFLSQGLGAHILGPRLIAPQFTVSAGLTEDDTGSWLDTSHDFFADSYGVGVSRRLYLSPDGYDLRGEDLFTPLPEHKVRAGKFAIRFHLHPSISSNLQAGGSSCLLITKSGRGWQFRARPTHEGQFFLEPSVSVGLDGRPERSQQIVLIGDLADRPTGFNWVLKFAGQIGKRRRQVA
jgi:uncharacterized heparinase superfamily protein